MLLKICLKDQEIGPGIDSQYCMILLTSPGTALGCLNTALVALGNLQYGEPEQDRPLASGE